MSRSKLTNVKNDKSKQTLKRPAKPQERQDLERLLALLDLSVLQAINNRSIEQDYGWGHQPLLRYTPEALKGYVTVIFPHLHKLGCTTKTMDEHIAQWLAPETILREWFAAREDAFIGILNDIVANPMPLPLYTIDDCLHTGISSFLSGDIGYFYFEDLCTLLYSNQSPLRVHVDDAIGDIVDQRVINLLAEVDAMRAKCDTDLASIISRDLRCYRRYVTECLDFYKLTPATIEMLISNKDKIPASDWDSITKALNAKRLAPKVKKLISKYKTAIKQGVLTPPATPTPIITQEVSVTPVLPADEYINRFSGLMEVAYSQLRPAYLKVHETPIAGTLDDIYAYLDAIALSELTGNSIDNIQTKQAEARDFFFEYNNIKFTLLACIKVILENLHPESVMTPEALSHGVVQGMLAFAEHIKYKLKHRILTLDYDRLAQELYHEIQSHTKGFAEALPLPTNLLLDEPVAVKTVPVPATVKPGPFDLTPPIQEILSDLEADSVTTSTKVLKAPDTDLLVPVDDPTIKNIAEMVAGHGSTPYLYNGDLVIQSDELFYKIVPTIRGDGYADYIFTAYNWTALTERIYRLQELLKSSAEYMYKYPDEQDYKYQPLSKDPATRKAAIDAAHEWAEVLLGRANHFIDDMSDKAAACIRNIANSRYYSKPLYISAHRLAAWVYYPVEYTAFIRSKLMDAEGNRLYYEPNHINGNRCDNRPENLKIVLKQDNLDLRSSSILVDYNGNSYPTLKAYCKATNAGNYTRLQQTIGGLQTGESTEYKSRTYTMDAKAKKITVTDKAPKIIFNNKPYDTLKAFADDNKLDYKSLHNSLSKARKAGKTEHNFKKFIFTFDSIGNVKITL